MTNITRANGTLKILNRKLVRATTATVATGTVVEEPDEGQLNDSQVAEDDDLVVLENGADGQVTGGHEDPEDFKENWASEALLKRRLSEKRPARELATKSDEQRPEAGEVGGPEKLKAANGWEEEAVRGEAEAEKAAVSATTRKAAASEFKAQVVWFNIFLFVLLHSSLPASLYLLYAGRVSWKTMAWSLAGMYISGLGVTGGAHRLWSHRSYKASTVVEVFLMCLQTMAGQNSIYTWSRDHRVHHKYSETDADPHNIHRGFFFAHMGWLCVRKHPDVKEKGKQIDMSDLEANRVVMFQHRHFWWLAIMFTVLLPTLVPVYFWGESFMTSFVISFMLRYLVTLHGTWLVNSAAHYYGSRPYDERIEARESPVVIYTGLGEGFHNYHHTFPFDYSTGEFGKYFNITTAFIDACAALGLVTDRRKMDSAVIASRQRRTGTPIVANCNS